MFLGKCKLAMSLQTANNVNSQTMGVYETMSGCSFITSCKIQVPLCKGLAGRRTTDIFFCCLLTASLLYFCQILLSQIQVGFKSDCCQGCRSAGQKAGRLGTGLHPALTLYRSRCETGGSDQGNISVQDIGFVFLLLNKK